MNTAVLKGLTSSIPFPKTDYGKKKKVLYLVVYCILCIIYIPDEQPRGLLMGTRYTKIFSINRLVNNTRNSDDLGLRWVKMGEGAIIRLRDCYRHSPHFAGVSTRQVPRWSLACTR